MLATGINDLISGNLKTKAGIFVWTKDYLFKVLTEGKNPPITSPNVALAFRKIDRVHFIPDKYKNLAYQDTDVEIGYGEKLTRPTNLAKMAELMNVKLGGKYLDIGSGSGFFAVLLGFLTGQTGSVISIDRIQWLWELSRTNLKKYPEIDNVKFLYRDGLDGLPNEAPFDGIHVAFSLKEVPQILKMQLNPKGGKLIVPTEHYSIKVITRLGTEEYIEEIVPGFSFDYGKMGLA